MIRLAFLILIFSSLPVMAAKIQSVKNNKVLLLLEGQSASPGQSFFVLDANGKKRAIVKIRQVKGDKAVAEITKGVAEKGYALASEPMAQKSTGASGEAAPKKLSRRVIEEDSEYSGNSWGVLGSVLMNSMSASFIPSRTGTKTTTNMSGMTFGALGFYDYGFSPELQIRLVAGVENYAVSGTTAGDDCDSSTTCDVKIMYLSSYAGGKYNFILDSSFRMWIGGFYGFLLALSKSSTVLATNDLTSNQMYGASVGCDVILSKNSFIPIELDYGIFPESSTVKANTIFVRAGWGTSF